MSIGKDACACSVLTEHVEYLLYIAALLASCVKFSVRESTCTSFAKGIVGLGIDDVASAYLGYVLSAFVYRLAALHYYRANAEFYKFQCSKQATRTCTHYHCLRATFHILILSVLILIVLRLFVDIHPHLQIDVDGALASIDASLQHSHCRHILHADALVFLQECLDALLVHCHFRQHSYLIFFCHSYCSFLQSYALFPIRPTIHFPNTQKTKDKLCININIV